ncbi:MAG: GNAT family N-acetyltransferase [Flavobacteriaceae bacterium]|nr:GNAT family N-acetyltransferase [Flavobacteriaceae bacterium]
MYTIERYSIERKTLWDDFVSKAKNSTFLFFRAYMDYHSERFEDHSLLIFRDGKLIGLLPANQEKDAIISHGGLTYGGFVLGPQVRFGDVLSGFQGVLQYFDDLKINRFSIKCMPRIYHRSPSDEMDYLLFKLNADRYRSDNLSVVIPKEAVYSRDRMQGVKRGKKHGLKVEETNDLDSFWNQILIPNLEQKHQSKPVHSLSEIQLLKSRFPKKIRQFNVYDQEGKIVAGTLIYDTERVARSQYISGNDDKNTLGSLDFLHDHLLQKVFKDKPYFDFGKSNENEGQVINEGLLYWKEGFGARSVAHDYYHIDPLSHTKLNAVMI